MIRINLLPHREAARKRRREEFLVLVGAAALLGAAIGGVGYLYYANEISEQQARNELLQSETQRLDRQIKDIDSLQQEIAALRARQESVEDLQADRNQPVNLMLELGRHVPEGVYITSLRQDGQNVTLQGVAQSNDRVSELLRNLGSRSEWLRQPELVEIVAGSTTIGREQRRVFNYTFRTRLLRASEVQKAAAKPAGAIAPIAAPASAPSAKG